MGYAVANPAYGYSRLSRHLGKGNGSEALYRYDAWVDGGGDLAIAIKSAWSAGAHQKSTNRVILPFTESLGRRGWLACLNQGDRHALLKICQPTNSGNWGWQYQCG